MAQLYKETKEKFDNRVYGYLAKRLLEPIEDTDAFGCGHVDEFGNELEPSEDWSYTKLDRLVLGIRAALGDRVKAIVKEAGYSGMDPLACMLGKSGPDDFGKNFSPVVKLVEEAAYIPVSERGKPGEIPDTDSPLNQRVSFALTVATYLLVCLLKDRNITPAEFDKEVLPGVEATFGVRSIGTAGEIAGYLRGAELIDGKDITQQGIVLAVRVAREIVKNDLFTRCTRGIDNLSKSWEQLARA